MKWAIYIFMMALLAMSVSAEFDIDVRPVKDIISPDETAKFEIKVSNKGKADSFRFYYDGVEWNIQPQSFILNADEETILEVDVDPLYVFPGQQAVPISIRTTSGILERELLLINVRSGEESTYRPSVRVEYDFPEKISPREDLHVAITLINQNPLNLSDLVIDIDSDLFSGFERLPLDPTTPDREGRAQAEFTFSFDEFLSPQEVPVTIRVTANKQSVFVGRETLEITTLDVPFNADVVEEQSFLKNVQTVTLYNDGNVEQMKQYKVEVPLFSQMFSTPTPDAAVLKEGGKRYYVWDITLGPNESTQVSVERNYRAFLLIILLLIIAIVSYFVLRSPVSILKTAQVVQKDEEGISMLKVQIKVKNISEKQLDNLVIYDTVPSLVNYIDEEQLGTLSPSRIAKHKSGSTVLKWDVDTIDGFEERIISYRIKTQLKVLGGINLPAVTAKFKNRFGKQRVVKSNLYKLSLRNK